jgi:hypothetical protein
LTEEAYPGGYALAKFRRLTLVEEGDEVREKADAACAVPQKVSQLGWVVDKLAHELQVSCVVPVMATSQDETE